MPFEFNLQRYNAEKEARKAFKEAEEAKLKRDHDYLSNMREEARATREKLAEEGRTAMLDVGLDDSDGEWEPQEEPPEVGLYKLNLVYP